MDAVISIGGQSFLDGLVRILGPALQPLRDPLSLPLPGLTNSILRIRSIQPVFPSANPGTIQLNLELDLAAEVLLVASVAAGTVNLTLGNGVVTLPPATGSVAEPLRNGTLGTAPGTGTVTGPITGAVGGALTANLNLALNALTGTVSLPAAAAPLSLNQIVGTIQLPAGGGTLGLPLPAVVPVALNLTETAPILAQVFLSPIVNGQTLVGSDAMITAATGFSMEFSFVQPDVQVAAVSAAVTTALQTAINTAITNVAAQLLQGLPALTQPATNLNAVVSNVTNAIPGTIRSVLTELVKGLRARTGRLIFPVPVPPPPGTSCEVAALPTAAKARITLTTGGVPLLQVGFDRTSVTRPSDTFPLFIPTATVDTGITVSNVFLRDILACLIEKFPNLAFTLPSTPTNVVGPPAVLSRAWPGVTVALGPLTFTGTLTLAITGTPAGPAMTPIPKAITLAFTSTAAILPLGIGPAFVTGLTFTLPLVFNLSSLASITSLRMMPPLPVLPTLTFGLGSGLITILTIAALVLGALPFVGPLPIIWGGFAILAGLLLFIPVVVAGIIRGLLFGAIGEILTGAHALLESPAALPQAIFDAFGKLVPTTMVVDDLVASGVLETPTSPWAVLPLLSKVKPPRPEEPHD